MRAFSAALLAGASAYTLIPYDPHTLRRVNATSETASTRHHDAALVPSDRSDVSAPAAAIPDADHPSDHLPLACTFSFAPEEAAS